MKEYSKTIGFIVIVIILLYLIQALLMPKYMNHTIEGSFISEYYQDIKEYGNPDHDVILLGDCGVYSNFNPMVLWEEYGINSYNRASPQQLIWQSYYLLEDTLRYETPDIVIFQVSSMKFDQPQSEAYNRMTLDGMEWSISKYHSIQASMFEKESIIDYIFPLLRYHSRWDELTSDDLTYLFSKESRSYNGFMPVVDVQPVTTIPEASILPNYEFGDICYEYLDKMRELCNQHNIEFVLIKAPSVYPPWYEQWDQQMIDYATKYDLHYVNFEQLSDEIGIDYQEDTYDQGLHLNVTGAHKVSNYLGTYLINHINLKNRKNDQQLNNMWKQKQQEYQQAVQQLKIKENVKDEK